MTVLDVALLTPFFVIIIHFVIRRTQEQWDTLGEHILLMIASAWVGAAYADGVAQLPMVGVMVALAAVSQFFFRRGRSKAKQRP